MTATIISNNLPWGSMTNQAVGRIISLNNWIVRLNEAVATASSGYGGVPGTQFETDTLNTPTNNFGVLADPTTPGTKGSDYAYAINLLASNWQTFWNAALPYIEQLDNGIQSM